jgi:diadenosine tetraphosphate (Ap4A) HIT family hydrolase
VQTGCFLCSAAIGIEDLSWHDRPLWLDPRAGLMVASLGGFSPGYVLIAPLNHEVSLRRAATLHSNSFLAFINETMAFLEKRLGLLTFWEHGAPTNREVRRSACIEHAHLHVVPGTLSLPKPPMQTTFATLNEALTQEIGTQETDGYMLLGWSGGVITVGRDVMIPQYYRREWAKLVGRPDEWDYLIAENAQITATTISRILTGGEE